MASIADRLVVAAFHLAYDEANNLAAQDEFAQISLDTEQGMRFRDLCVQVRESRAGDGQQILDSVARIVERK